MTSPFYIQDARGARRVDAASFPLAVGGADADIPLPNDGAHEPVAYLGISDGEVFVQPTPERGATSPILCNGTALLASHWLRHGDVLRIGAVRILVEGDAGKTSLRVEDNAKQQETDPPIVASTSASPKTSTSSTGSTGSTGSKGSGGSRGPAQSPPPKPAAGIPIKPIQFEPQPLDRSVHRRRSFSGRWLLFWVPAAALGAFAWVVFSVRGVTVEVAPAPEALHFDGSLPAVELGGHYFMQPGTYRLRAEAEGYHVLDVPIEVTTDRNQSFAFSMTELPGLLTITTTPPEGVLVVVDGAEVGNTPLAEIELEPGEHEIHLQAQGYIEVVTSVSIDGKGARSEVSAELTPIWAPVSFASTPPGATIRVDGRAVGKTPTSARLLEGGHAYELVLSGFKPYRGRIVVEANKGQKIGPITLDETDGMLSLTSVPPEANVTVDGVYQGQTPLDLELEPEKPHELLIAHPGFETATRRIELASGETERMAVDLQARIGQVEIVADPADAELFINGQSRGKANGVLELPATPHHIEIKKAGYEGFSTDITPRPGFPQTIEATLVSEAEAKVARRLPVIQTSQKHELRLIDPLQFSMGASRREPGRRANETLREVEITQPYYISTTEVMNLQFREFKKGHRSGDANGHNLEVGHHPVVQVTWEDAARYCNWLSAKDSLPPAYVVKGDTLVPASPPTTGYRLPTEAEWVRASRYASGDGDKPMKYPWGMALPVAPGSGNYADLSAVNLVATTIPNYNDTFPVTAPVDSFAPNALGLHNMGGNVAEWVQDYYTVNASSGPGIQKDPMGPSEGTLHVIKGSSWMQASVSELRLSYRDYGDKARPDLGFRIARNVE